MQKFLKKLNTWKNLVAILIIFSFFIPNISLAQVTVTTLPASSIGPGSAVLNGSVAVFGQSTTVLFRYTITNPNSNSCTALTNYSQTLGQTFNSGGGSNGGTFSFSAAITGLIQGTTYYFCALDPGNSAYGTVLNFTTSGNPPPVGGSNSNATISASNITYTSALLSATNIMSPAGPNGAGETVYFRYTTNQYSGCSNMVGYNTSQVAVASPQNNWAVSIPVSNLLAGTTYYYCLAIEPNMNIGNPLLFSNVATFLTLGSNNGGQQGSGGGPIGPVETLAAAIDQTTGDTQVTLNGFLHSNGGKTAYGYFRYTEVEFQPPLFCNDIYGSNMVGVTASQPNLNGVVGSDKAFSRLVTGLKPSTMYSYCAVASNKAYDPTGAQATDIAYGEVFTFMTLPCQTCPHTTVQSISAAVTSGETAILKGSYSSTKQVTTYFQYKLNLKNAQWQDAAGSFKDHNAYTYNTFSFKLDGLAPITSYQFRAVAKTSNPDEIFYGAALNFTTPKKTLDPVIGDPGGDDPGFTGDQNCPAGYTGKFPKCIPMTDDPIGQATCPSGYSGTYPNCVLIVPPTVTVTATKSPINPGEYSGINWTSANTTSCNGGPTSGSMKVGPLYATKKYLVTCEGPGGTTGGSAIVIVNGAPPTPLPTVKVTVTASPIAPGQYSGINWTSENTTSCNGGPTSGSMKVGPLYSTKKFLVTCVGPGGSAGDGGIVIVNGSGGNNNNNINLYLPTLLPPLLPSLPTLPGIGLSGLPSVPSVPVIGSGNYDLPPFAPPADIDGDGIPDLIDWDLDGNGILNYIDPDVDGDGILNGLDLDIDGDGIPNSIDSTPYGYGSVGDIDGDGIPDNIDWDLNGNGILNVLDLDIDGDGIPNLVDPDDDGDGILDGVDLTPNGYGTVGDVDGDGIPDNIDWDLNGNGIPNLLDLDTDGDGIPNLVDGDDDGDGILDGVDITPVGFGSLYDLDGDGIPNNIDPDVDGDGIPNNLDLDIDGDGIPNNIDWDIDGDGIPNNIDTDIDGDGIPNNIDTDIDGDGIPNLVDSTPNGIGNNGTISSGPNNNIFNGIPGVGTWTTTTGTSGTWAGLLPNQPNGPVDGVLSGPNGTGSWVGNCYGGVCFGTWSDDNNVLTSGISTGPWNGTFGPGTSDFSTTTNTWSGTNGSGPWVGTISNNSTAVGTWTGGTGLNPATDIWTNINNPNNLLFNGLSGTGNWTLNSNGQSGTWSGVFPNQPNGQISGTWNDGNGNSGTFEGICTQGVCSGTFTVTNSSGNGMNPNGNLIGSLGTSTNSIIGTWQGSNPTGTSTWNGINLGSGTWQGTGKTGTWSGVAPGQPDGSVSGTFSGPNGTGNWIGTCKSGVCSGTWTGGNATGPVFGNWNGTDGKDNYIFNNMYGTGIWTSNGNGTGGTWSGIAPGQPDGPVSGTWGGVSNGNNLSDIDGDGIPNVFDNDMDGDGIPNNIDTDIDGDGIPNASDSTPNGIGTLTDIDGDGIPNNIDWDIDGDGIPNVFDNDMDGDGIPNNIDTDIDGDGIPNASDSTPNGIGTLTDIDGDGVPNNIDTDDDGDGIPDAVDSTPSGASDTGKNSNGQNTFTGTCVNGVCTGTWTGSGIPPNSTGTWDGSKGKNNSIWNGLNGEGVWTGKGKNGNWNGNSTDGDGLGIAKIGSKVKPNWDAIVHKTEGVETVFIRQIINNPDFAGRYGWSAGQNILLFAYDLAHYFGINFGYVDPKTLKEVRVVPPDVAAYQFWQNGNTLLVYEVYKDEVKNIKSFSNKLKDKYTYEYYFTKKVK